MDPIVRDDLYRNIRILSMVQETRLVLICEEQYIEDAPEEGPDTMKEGTREIEIIVDSNRRPVPVPYSEEP